MRLAVIGAGWAGLAAAVRLTQLGHSVVVFEAAREVGGRARTVVLTLPDGRRVEVDNGQHIMIGAYRETLRLMEQVGVEPSGVLLRMPLQMRFPDGGGIAFPDWPAPLDAAAGILRARGWSWRDKSSLLARSAVWQMRGFRCAASASVLDVCASLTPRVMDELVEPLCVSALNTPAARASGEVFLRVVRDSLFGRGYGAWGGSNLLLPRVTLGALFPLAAGHWIRARGAQLRLGARVTRIARETDAWTVDGERYDAVLLALPPWEAARLAECGSADAQLWSACAQALRHEAIATVYAMGGPRLPAPMLALRTSADAPAQFVFDRSQLGGPEELLAFVVSASGRENDVIQQQVLAQASQLGWTLAAVRTVVEKRATFACTPALERPRMQIAPGLLACGDYVAGPYPATIEGAVRSALAAADSLGGCARP